jgi:serine/threonine protein phosphatase PrpC
MSQDLIEALLLADERQPRLGLGQTEGGTVAVFSSPYPNEAGPNQDCAAVFPLGRTTVIAVADGLGGAPSGHLASRIAADCLSASLAAIDEAGSDARALILDAFDNANRSIRELGVGAGTTLAVVEIRDNVVRPYHVGDSSILVCGSRGKVKFVSIPHSPVGYGVEAGLIDAEDALHHAELNVVSNTLGSPDMRIELGTPFELAAQDTVVLATDGLFDNLRAEEIVEIVRTGPLAEVAPRLAELATQRMTVAGTRHPSKPDDLTFALYRPRA